MLGLLVAWQPVPVRLVPSVEQFLSKLRLRVRRQWNLPKWYSRAWRLCIAVDPVDGVPIVTDAEGLHKMILAHCNTHWKASYSMVWWPTEGLQNLVVRSNGDLVLVFQGSHRGQTEARVNLFSSTRRSRHEVAVFEADDVCVTRDHVFVRKAHQLNQWRWVDEATLALERTRELTPTARCLCMAAHGCYLWMATMDNEAIVDKDVGCLVQQFDIDTWVCRARWRHVHSPPWLLTLLPTPVAEVIVILNVQDSLWMYRTWDGQILDKLNHPCVSASVSPIDGGVATLTWNGPVPGHNGACVSQLW